MKFKIVKTFKQAKKVVSYCKQTKIFCHDFETTSEKFYNDEDYPTILGVSFQPGYAYVIPLGHFDSPFKKNYEKILSLINRELLTDPEVIKIAWNIKFEKKWFMRYGYHNVGRQFDPMLAKYLLDEERPNDLKSIVNRFEPTHGDYEKEIDTLVRKYGWAGVPLKKLAKYCAYDCDLTLKLMIRFEPKLIKGDFYRLFRSEKMPLVSVLAKSEFEGIPIDVEVLKELEKKYTKLIADNELALRKNKRLIKFEKYMRNKKITEYLNNLNEEIEQLRKEGKDRQIKSREEKISRVIAGNYKIKQEKAMVEPFNFGSPQQVVQLFYKSKKGFRFPILDYTGTGSPSTAEETIVKLKSKVKDKQGKEFLEQLLKSRELEKLHSTYIAGIREKLSKDNKIHTGFLVHGTVTGRLSSVGPNMQNIPRVTTNPDIKRMFIPKPGHILIEVDYSQAELRILAEMTDDKAMIDIFKRNWNIHVATACKMFNGEYDKVKGILADDKHKHWLKWEKQKKIGKSMNFSIVYLQGDAATAEQMGVSLTAAKGFKSDWFNSFANVKPWINRRFKEVERDGYVKTMFGQKRRLPNVYSSDSGIKFQALRQSVNAPIQGTSGQFTNFSTIMIDEAKKRGLLPADMQQLWTVHDSIGFSISPKDVRKAIPLITKICENPETKKYFGFEMKKVRMKVSPEVGSRWSDLQDYNPFLPFHKMVRPLEK